MIDWQQLVLNLRRDYLSLHTIANKHGFSVRHLQGLARGEINEPRFNSGLRLLDLHIDKCGIEKHRRLLTR